MSLTNYTGSLGPQLSASGWISMAMPGCWSGTQLTRRRQALGDHGEKVWLRKARQGLLARLALAALPCQESAEAPGPACLAIPPRLVGAPRTPPRGRPGGLGASDACSGTGGSRGDPTSVDASASPFLRPQRLWLRWRESMWPSPPPRSHAALQHPRSNYTPGWPAAPGKVSHHQLLSCWVSGWRAAGTSWPLGLLCVLWGRPLAMPPRAPWGRLPPRSGHQGAATFLVGFLHHLGCKFLKARDLFLTDPGFPGTRTWPRTWPVLSTYLLVEWRGEEITTGIWFPWWSMLGPRNHRPGFKPQFHPLTSYITVGKSYNLCRPQPLVHKVEIGRVSIYMPRHTFYVLLSTLFHYPLYFNHCY